VSWTSILSVPVIVRTVPEVCFRSLRFLLDLYRELGHESDVVRGVVNVRESRNSAEVLFVNLSEEAGNTQSVGRVPDVIDTANERRCVVGKLELTNVRVR
jgi:hypothetical protein